MDGAIEPPWMGLRRVQPAHPDPAIPQQRTADQPLLLLLLPSLKSLPQAAPQPPLQGTLNTQSA